VLVRVDRVLDLSWLRDEAADRYCLDDSRPGIDPEVAVRFMLAGLLSQIVHDRRLMREAEVNLAIRWFAGYALRAVRRGLANMKIQVYLTLLWQIYSRCFSSLIQDRQYGHR
jgi:hypothetical protein